MNNEVTTFLREKGILLEKEIYDLISSIEDTSQAKKIIEQLEIYSGQKIITKSTLTKNITHFKNRVSDLPGTGKTIVENIFIKLGINIEVQKETRVEDKQPTQQHFKIFSANTRNDKKIEVADFVGNFRSRYQQLQKILMERPALKNLVAINKISQDRQILSFIGIVTEKRMTKNRNLIVTFEDLTGKISALVKADNAELFTIANELQLDDVVGVKASGNKDLAFIHDIFFPDAFIHEKTKFNEEVCVAFLSDVHAGSDRHLGKSFNKFLDWLNSDHELAQKVKYVFFTGDNVDGVGIFPGQERVLALKSMKEQYELLASYLKRVPKHITMFMCPGQHDAARVAEPQPIIDKRYAPQLYDIENLILVTNPCLVKLLEQDKEFKVLMYHGASIHSFINEIPELREIKAHRTPARAVRHMLKRRHLAPTHSEVVYIPNKEHDPLVIYEVPDVLCTGEVHRLDIENYNGVLIITGSCWQAQTDFEEKIGNIPDPTKVPIVNLKTRELKILDFGDEEELKNAAN
jgi:DNA polymerase II small subunit